MFKIYPCGLIKFLCLDLFLMDWKCFDERLIGRGGFLLSLDFHGDYEFEPSLLNEGKVGGV